VLLEKVRVQIVVLIERNAFIAIEVMMMVVVKSHAWRQMSVIRLNETNAIRLHARTC